jgi:hypothetical protein
MRWLTFAISFRNKVPLKVRAWQIAHGQSFRDRINSPSKTAERNYAYSGLGLAGSVVFLIFFCIAWDSFLIFLVLPSPGLAR